MSHSPNSPSNPPPVPESVGGDANPISAAALPNILARLAQLEAEVAMLRAALVQTGAATPGRPQQKPPSVYPEGVAAVPGPPPFVMPATAVPPHAAGAVPPPANMAPPANAAGQAAQAAAAKPGTSEQTFGLAWLNAIGVVTLIIGIGFLFKLAVDNAWLGPTGRVVFGVITGFSVLVAGTFLHRRGHRLYSQGIFSLGLGILYLSFYAGFAFYGFLPSLVAFFLLTLTSALGAYLAVRHDAQFLLLLGLFLGYLTPGLVDTGRNAQGFLALYLLGLHAGAFLSAAWQGWHVSRWVLFVVAPMVMLSWAIQSRGVDHMTGSAAIMAHLFLLTWPIRPLRNQRVEPAWLPILMEYSGAALVIGLGGALLCQTMLYNTGRPEEPVVQLVYLTAALLWAVRRNWPGFGLAAGVWFYLASFQWIRVAFATADIRLVQLLAGFGTILFYLVATLRDRLPSLSLLASNGLLFLTSSYLLLSANQLAEWQSALCLAVALTYGALAYSVWGDAARRISRDSCLALAGASLVIFAGNYFSGSAVPAVWAVQAMIAAYAAARLGKGWALWGAIGLAALSLLRQNQDPQFAILPDQAPIANARFVAGFLASAALLSVSAFARHYGAVLPSCPIMWPALGGHLAMVFTLVMEAISLSRKAFPEQSDAASAASGTLVISLYAGLLVLAGLQLREAGHRQLGLGLLAIALGKLYLVDVWVLRLGWRVAAFLGLGLLLLTASWLYSRRPEKLRQFLGQEAEGREADPSSALPNG